MSWCVRGRDFELRGTLTDISVVEMRFVVRHQRANPESIFGLG